MTKESIKLQTTAMLTEFSQPILNHPVFFNVLDVLEQDHVYIYNNYNYTCNDYSTA